MRLWYGTGYGSICIGSGWLLIKTFICGMLAVEARESSVGPVTTRNEATPGNEAKKTLPENVANFVGGYIFWEPHTQK